MRCEVTNIPLLGSYWERYRELPKQPLRITTTLSSPVVTAEKRLNLDGILAYAVVLEASKGEMIGEFPVGVLPFLPTPLGVARMIDGLPLWRSTQFMGERVHGDITHYHRRSGDNPYLLPAMMTTLGEKRARRQPSSIAGQYMDNRIPLERLTADRWVATCEGNAEEIERLLAYVLAVGKHGRIGYGRIVKFAVESMSEEFSFFADVDGVPRALRPIPVDSPNRGGTPCGWTPAYYRKEAWRLCAPVFQGVSQ